jgi:hypothetical protein
MMDVTMWQEVAGWLFLLFFITALLEAFLAHTWNKAYFTVGIPILIWHAKAKPNRPTPPEADELNWHLRSSWTYSLVFKEVAKHQLGFREKFFQLRVLNYTPLMHGLLQFDASRRRVTVKGLVNWAELVFLAIPLAIIIPNGPMAWLLGSAALLLVVGLVYWIHLYRYTQVALVAARLWSEINRAA